MLRFDLPFSRYSRSNGQNLGPQFRIWGYLGEPLPKGEKTCPGPIRTIMPNFTPIGATVADICNRTKKKTANLLPCHTNIWRVTSVLAKHSTRHTGVDKFRIWGFLGHVSHKGRRHIRDTWIPHHAKCHDDRFTVVEIPVSKKNWTESKLSTLPY